MSTRTIIEINHDFLRERGRVELMDLWSALPSSEVARLLNLSGGKPFNWSSGVRVLAQRHHSETLTLKVK